MNSLGLEKDPKDTRVIVAMSGGVDSSATAALLVEEGYDVVGLTLQLYDHGEAVARGNTCCAGVDIRDARRVAAALGIPHYVLDMEETFKRDVIEDFADTYLAGKTPVPCVRCNETVKFRDLLDKAQSLGGDILVTGHYAQWRMGENGPELLRGVDHNKDQSYFLFATTKEQLEFIRFPLGDRSKHMTRALAEKHGLKVAAKPESQDICFVPTGSYADVVERLRPGSGREGEIVTQDGEVIGRHKGIIHYTVGQRRGLNIGGGTIYYVLEIDAANNRLIVGPKEALEKTAFTLSGVNWLGEGDCPPKNGIAVSVKMRSLQIPVEATLYGAEDGCARVELVDPHQGIAPGQACVFYDGERVLGGGWIEG